MMNQEMERVLDPRIQQAIDELRRMILARYPGAQFSVERGHDEPENVHLMTTVDLDDPDEVVDLVLDRMIELEVDERIPVYVIAVRTPERILAEMKHSRGRDPDDVRRVLSSVGTSPRDR
jgi:hypothetical protein